MDLTGIPGKPFKILQNSGIPQEFESAGFGILHKLLLSFLEILKFLGTQFSVVHRGCVDIFWNSPLSQRSRKLSTTGVTYPGLIRCHDLEYSQTCEKSMLVLFFPDKIILKNYINCLSFSVLV